MTDTAGDPHLIDDVILTLANLRQMLGWLADDGARRGTAVQEGVRRAEFQIDLLLDRAHAARSAVRSRPAAEGDLAAAPPLVLTEAMKVLPPDRADRPGPAREHGREPVFSRRITPLRPRHPAPEDAGAPLPAEEPVFRSRRRRAG